METLSPVAVVVIGMTALVVLVAGMLNIAVAMKTLFVKPALDPDKQFVTREELQKAVADLKADMSNKINDLDRYAHTVAHEQAGAMNVIGLKIERLLTFRESEAAQRARRKNMAHRAKPEGETDG